MLIIQAVELLTTRKRGDLTPTNLISLNFIVHKIFVSALAHYKMC